MYHYTGSGLSNIWLRNGYKTITTPYGKATAIADLFGLNRSIGLKLTMEKPHLSGPEFRFLRKELELSQLALAKLMGMADAQALAKWEKLGRVATLPDRFIRQLYLEAVVKKSTRFTDLIQRLQDAEESERNSRMVFAEQAKKGWTAVAA